MEAKNAIIITIGDELLMGQVVDTNSGWIAGKLDEINVPTIKRIAIPDDSSVIKKTLDDSIPLADYIIITGGLGPTKDDLTKKSLTEYFGGNLVNNKIAYLHIRDIFSSNGREIKPEHEAQALVPDSCIVLQNSIGTAPGMWFEKEEHGIISLPGVPYEMKNIFINEVLPRIKKKYSGFYRSHRYFLLMNASETAIARKIEVVENSLPDYIKLAYLPGAGTLRLRLSGGHEDEQKLQRELNHFATEISDCLQGWVAANDDLPIEAVVGMALKKRGLTLGFAESCTGGLLASKITNIPGSSEYFKGGVVSYANEVKKQVLNISEQTLLEQGAVSEATVLQMAKQVRLLLNVDIALAVSGILGPGGGSDEKPVGTVWMAISDKEKTAAQCFHFRYNRLQNKERAANAALEWLRKWLDK